MKEQLIQQIKEANEAYRIGNPIISDEAFDALLEKVEAYMNPIEFEVFKTKLTENSGDYKHEYVIGSLNKVKYGENQLQKWIQKNNARTLVISEKVDGCSFCAIYKNGKFVSGASRGDGITGKDWTEKLKHILPQEIMTSHIPDFIIRGELVLCEGDYQKLGFKNGRNGAVGIMNCDEVNPYKLKLVTALVYDILKPENLNAIEIFNIISSHFTTPIYRTVVVESDIEEVLKEQYHLWKSNAPYGMDGLVVSSIDYINENVHLPEGKMAFKVNQDAVLTTVEGIEWNVSKNGAVKPVVLVKPTNIDGTTVSRVTGFNAQYIQDNGIGVDATISILKSGEIVPKIIDIIKKSDSAKLPTHCPSCFHPLQWKGVDIVCDNTNCSTQKVKKITSFLRDCGVEGITEKSLANWNINSFDDLINWKPERGSKSQASFEDELKKHIWNKDATTLFSYMVFDGCGKTNIDKIVEHYGFDAIDTIILLDKTPSDYPEGIGEKTIDNLRSSWKSNKEWLLKLTSDSRWNPMIVKPVDGKLSGKMFLITGTLSKGRSVIEKEIVNAGGKIASSVVKNLSYLICGADQWGNSTKFQKAEKLGVPIITEEQLKSMIQF